MNTKFEREYYEKEFQEAVEKLGTAIHHKKHECDLGSYYYNKQILKELKARVKSRGMEIFMEGNHIMAKW